MSQFKENTIEKLVYAQVTAKYLSGLESENARYEAYEYLTACIEQGKDPDLTAWQPFEHWDWEDIAETIDNEASTTLSLLEHVLNLAKEGIVCLTVNDVFSTDMNQLDMKNMVELGVHQTQYRTEKTIAGIKKSPKGD